jgi:hypothetical protein
MEDDDRVGYAYLLDEQLQIVADVWLYNVCEAPTQPEWIGNDLMPFANPAAYVRSDVGLEPLRNSSDIRVEWGTSDEGAVKATIFLKSDRYAVLINGAKPGWTIAAAKNSPLAHVLEVSES